MVKRSSDLLASTDKAKVRVFFAEVEGNNDSVQEALKTMVSAMSRPVRVVSDQRNVGHSTNLPDKGEAEQGELQIDLPLEAETKEPDELVVQSSRKLRGTGKKTDRNAGLELVADLNFRPTGEATLKDFFDGKHVESDVETVTVLTYYLQHKMGVSKIGPSHILTAMKAVAKPVPADLRQTIRNIQKTRAWLKFSDIEGIRTTTQGENFVEHEAGKAE